MTTTQRNAMAAILVACGANKPEIWERIKEWIWSRLPFTNWLIQTDHFSVPPSILTTDYSSVIFNLYFYMASQGVTDSSWITPWNLEQIGDQALTYPFTRSDTGVLDVPTH